MRFWDSSAIIPLCLEEPHSEAMRLLAGEDGELAFWWGTPVECSSSFARLRREGSLSADDEQQSASSCGSAYPKAAPSYHHPRRYAQRRGGCCCVIRYGLRILCNLLLPWYGPQN